MSYSLQTGLAYIPTFNMCMDITNKEEKYTPGKFYLASEFNLDMPGSLRTYLAEFIAWDPVAKNAPRASCQGYSPAQGYTGYAAC